MLSIKKLTGFVLACGLALWLPTSCSDDDSGNNNNNQTLCGNGVIDQGEECDGTELNDETCMDRGFTGGTLDCTADCHFDESHCIAAAECGNGKVDQGEECDCGTDANDLPNGCPAINGAEGANCNSDCTVHAICGNGIREGSEQCDCGTDDQNLPSGCEGINGQGSCDSTCHESGSCSANHWETCDPSTLGDCCPDSLGTSYDCTSLGSGAICLAPCNDTSECYYNNQCEQTNLQGHCWPALCGPGSNQYIGGIGGDLNTTCQIPGGGEGWCFPINTADANFAFCWESGTAQQGEECTQIPDDGDILTTMLSRDDSSVVLCDMGLCLNDGTCANFCNWEDVYANGETCPEGTNCFPQTFFYSEDPNDPQDDDMDGHRWADEAICLPIDMDPQKGIVSCDLMNGELTSDRTKTCADYDPDPNNGLPMACVPIAFDRAGNEMSASVMGVCTEMSAAPNKAVYDACDPSQGSEDVCPAGTICQPDDLFANPTSPTEQAHCLPLCDTEGTACADAHAELPSTFTCTSFSTLFAPGTNPGTTADGSPSRLGVCACPPSGCVAAPVCGNGIQETGEECDNGASNSDTAADACRTDCTNARCGDNVIDTGEQCDDGNTDNGDGCDSTCQNE